jgi:hypothetical protein
MKKFYLIGFRGTGIRNPRYGQESALIRVGHVGFAFEGDEMRIFGFHPTQEAAQGIGDNEAVLTWLRKLKPLSGALHLNTDIFVRAYQLAKQGARTKVWQMEIALADDEFERVHNQVLSWYTDRQMFTYSFPDETTDPNNDNCATFPRRLGLPLPELTGQLGYYIPALAAQGSEWHPGESEQDEPNN